MHERGRGDGAGDGSEMCEIQVINLWMRETRTLCVVEKKTAWLIITSSRPTNPVHHENDSCISSITAGIMQIRHIISALSALRCFIDSVM